MSAQPWIWTDANVVNVVDGDTFDARLARDIGFHGVVSFVQRFRLNRINAPKLHSPNGQASRQFVVAAVVRPVSIQSLKAYKYGDEWMAEVMLPDGSNLSDLLVAQGHAVYWDGHGVRPADELHGPPPAEV